MTEGPNPSSNSNPDGSTSFAAHDTDAGALALDGTSNGALHAVDALRDAGAGKVRGPHGRYVNKNNGSSPATKNGPRIKHVRKCKSSTAYTVAEG